MSVEVLWCKASTATAVLSIMYLISMQVKEDTAATERGSRFFQIVCNLACIEVIMNLEDKQLDEDVLENSELLVACYFIIESAVSYLVNQGYVYL